MVSRRLATDPKLNPCSSRSCLGSGLAWPALPSRPSFLTQHAGWAGQAGAATRIPWRPAPWSVLRCRAGLICFCQKVLRPNSEKTRNHSRVLLLLLHGVPASRQVFGIFFSLRHTYGNYLPRCQRVHAGCPPIAFFPRSGME